MKNSTKKRDLWLIFITVGAFILVFLAGMKYQKEEIKTDDEYISIHQYNEVVNQLHYANSVKRAWTYVAYQLHHDIAIDSVFIKYANDHIWVPRTEDKHLYIKWENATPDETPLDLVKAMDSTIAVWYESIPFMFMDNKHDSTWVYNSDSYKRSQDAINHYKTRTYE